METVINIKHTNDSYRIIAQPGLIKEAGSYLADYQGKRAAIITDTNVAAIYLEDLKASLAQSGISSVSFIVAAGEQSKCHETLLQLYEQLVENQITRGDFIIALGGGVIGDLAGFAAATYLRGIPFVQIPTTLLAQVDSSVGGKVGVNLPQGKNLIGAFWQPALVLSDSSALETLDRRQLLAGLAEVVKYGYIYKPEILDVLELNPLDAENLAQLVIECCRAKAHYVEADPFDKGLRMVLNFGHTLGHGLEKNAGYGTILHGEGVAIGMVAAARWGEALGITPSGTVGHMLKLFAKLGLPVEANALFEISAGKKQAIKKSLVNDKKTFSQQINLILLQDIGKAIIHPMSQADFLALAERYI